MYIPIHIRVQAGGRHVHFKSIFLTLLVYSITYLDTCFIMHMQSDSGISRTPSTGVSSPSPAAPQPPATPLNPLLNRPATPLTPPALPPATSLTPPALPPATSLTLPALPPATSLTLPAIAVSCVLINVKARQGVNLWVKDLAGP